MCLCLFSFCYKIKIFLEDAVITEKDLKKAEFCRDKCLVCKYARKKQRGILFWFVKSVEGDRCPYCQAYEKVYGKKAHEKLDNN